MPYVRLVSTLLVFLGILPGLVTAQPSMPESRFVYARDVDFYGSDLGNLFDTTREACARACAAQEACVGFTFNSLKNACFPKSAVSQKEPYVGALSATKILTAPSAITLAATRQAELAFLSEDDIQNARLFVQTNADRFPASDIDFSNFLDALAIAEARNAISDAARAAGSAIALSDRGDLWARLAEVSLRSDDNSRFIRQLRREAVPAAINAYLRAPDGPQQVVALDMLARALEENGRGRDMVPALRLATNLSPRPDLVKALDEAVAKHGFRITEHRIDNNSSNPRICAEFSENLVQVGLDYAPFVQLPDAGLVVQAEGRQICIDGVDHGTRYNVTFRKGLPASSGEALHKDIALKLYVQDRTPSVRFSGRAFVLPRSATAGLPVETVNADTVELKLRRVSDRNLVRTIKDSYFGKPLNTYEDEYFAESLAEEIWTGTGTVQNTLNADMTTRLPLGDALADQPPGIYALSAAIPGQDRYEYPAATQWFVLTDLGLSTWSGVDGLHVAVRSLSDAQARSDVKLALISRANAVLGEVTTDAEGFASFAAGLSRGTGASATALVVAEWGDEDIAFIPLTDPAFDLSDRGVEGHPPSPPIDTFLTTDRGAYRAGDTIFATALTRDDKGQALNGLPLVAVLKRPDGVEYSRSLSQNSKAGGHVFALPVAASAPRGAWRVDVIADPSQGPLASQTVLVEDFLPERIDFDLSLPNAPLRLGETPPLSVSARYLFGAPGADLAIEGEVRLRASRELDGWQGYRFGAYDQRFDTRTSYLDPALTDAGGNATLALKLPALDETPATPLEAEVILRVAEGSGRPVERRMTKRLTSEGPMIGIKPGFADTLAEGVEAAFDVIAVTDGATTEMPVRWTLNRVNQRYQWYQLYGNWEWEPVIRRTRIATGDATLGATPLPLSLPVDWGQYELIVETVGAVYAQSSVQFSSGWYGGGDSSATPDLAEVSLDQAAYDKGDMAELRIMAKDAGVALVSVLSNRVISRKTVAVAKGENLIPLEVTSDWGSSAYVSASVIRPMNAAEGLNPARSLGLAHATVRPGAKQLAVRIDTPAEVDGQLGSFIASVQVDGVTPGQTAYVTLAAVDVGILNLTAFDAPDPSDHYFGQRRLGVELRDLYGRLIDGLNGAMGSVRSGGDAASAAQLQSPPPTEKLMAFFAGPMVVGADGRVEIVIEKPGFNGTIRLMAIAWSEGSVGNASADLLARDPVVVTASLPRHLAPGDTSRLLLELVHATGSPGDMQLEVTAGRGIVLGDVPIAVTLTDQGSARLPISLRAREVGDQEITVELTTPDGKILLKTLQMPVRDNDPETAITRQFALGAGDSFTFDTEVFAGLRKGTASATLSAGPLARYDVPGLLRQLDRYPYGCTEQVTSAALPLLYLSSLAEESGLGAPAELDRKIATGIDRVLARQSSNGAFGLWSVGSGEFWLDAYVTDFLFRADAEGHKVPPRALSQAMDNLRNRISYAPDFDDGGEDIAYALLVLARAGAASMSDLRYYADTKGNDFRTPMAAAQLGSALAAYGDPSRADRMFVRASELLERTAKTTGWRSDFGSELRDSAALLTLASEVGSTAINTAQIAKQISTSRRRLSTQEAAQVTMAAHALNDGSVSSGLLVDGEIPDGPFVTQIDDGATKDVRIQNNSTAAMDVTMTTFGVLEIPPEKGGYGYSIDRRYYTLDGAEITGPVASGTRLVTVLKVTPFEDLGARLIIDDPLPGGFEIDNPNLIRGGDVKALDWLEPKSAENAEFRADRFVAAVNHSGTEPFVVSYVVRAVTPGSYHHPAATVGDMYRPEYRANTQTGAVTVTP
ncbi:PAN domain-containing protein [Sulfitobacter sp. SK012]|uniref:alpha-2-macroglobulin family protein n=1 Tax=Sulfitobacter sp. SK012 TaxID=1389005 RepID=UPI000E0A668D|nr:MG2 domain-containing protein [Sulfitobacter sp. SK012]AXI44830.1 PAN domain-containing protein [Sulfitobacter sp. SK012]